MLYQWLTRAEMNYCIRDAKPAAHFTPQDINSQMNAITRKQVNGGVPGRRDRDNRRTASDDRGASQSNKNPCKLNYYQLGITKFRTKLKNRGIINESPQFY